jgi:hypothetical protein
MAVLTLLLWMDGWAAMSTRQTRGCGSLGAASPAAPAWGVLTVDQTTERKHAVSNARDKRAAKTKQLCEQAPA